MELSVLRPLTGRSLPIIGRKPTLSLLLPTTLPLRLSFPQFSTSTSSSTSCLSFPIVFAAHESNLSVSNESETSEWVMQDFYTLRKDIEIASARVEEIRDSAGLQQLEQEVAHLESKATDNSFWDDRAKAQETLSTLNDLKDRMRLLSEFKSMVRYTFVKGSLKLEMPPPYSVVIQESEKGSWHVPVLNSGKSLKHWICIKRQKI